MMTSRTTGLGVAYDSVLAACQWATRHSYGQQLLAIAETDTGHPRRCSNAVVRLSRTIFGHAKGRPLAHIARGVGLGGERGDLSDCAYCA